ncbi:MAG: transposase [Planctomycetaceae bacterium]|nr:transposase [Planctomycetaceae bacterium]
MMFKILILKTVYHLFSDDQVELQIRVKFQIGMRNLVYNRSQIV